MNGPSNDWFWDRFAEVIKAILIGAYVVMAGLYYRIRQQGRRRDAKLAGHEERIRQLEMYCREQKEIAGEVKADIRDIKHDLNALTLALLRPPGH